MLPAVRLQPPGNFGVLPEESVRIQLHMEQAQQFGVAAVRHQPGRQEARKNPQQEQEHRGNNRDMDRQPPVPNPDQYG